MYLILESKKVLVLWFYVEESLLLVFFGKGLKFKRNGCVFIMKRLNYFLMELLNVVFEVLVLWDVLSIYEY